jgi:hypothetical protein
MRILLPTGALTEKVVRCAAAGFDADVVVTGEIASFLTPHMLRALIKKRTYDLVIVSGMCTASFEQVERETGIPVYRGPRHAADLIDPSTTLTITLCEQFLLTIFLQRNGLMMHSTGSVNWNIVLAHSAIRDTKIGCGSRIVFCRSRTPQCQISGRLWSSFISVPIS